MIKGDAMRNPVCFIAKQSLLLSGLWLFATLAAAEQGSAAVNVPLRSMSQAEYELYRERLQKQVREAAADMPEQGKPAEEDAAEKDKSEDSGYGRGYRARSERSGRTGGGYRGGSLSRGGGRGR
jgi:hypothetical protein